MDQTAALEELDRGWDTDLAPEAPHRRIGLRVAVNLWALLRARGRSLYAQALELSPTGVVLGFVGVPRAVRFHGGQTFGLDLFVPGSSSPIRATVRPARALGVLQAFELLEIGEVDRLTLAEYIDEQRAARRVVVSGHVHPHHPGTLNVRA